MELSTTESIAVVGDYALLYCAVHSVLASRWAKGWSRRLFGPSADRWYRLFYNLVVVAALLPLGWLMLWLPDSSLYVLPMPWLWLALLGQAGAAAGIAYGAWLTDGWQFLGLRQLAQPASNAGVVGRLVVSGPYRWVRHPLYFFGLILMWLTPQMTANRIALYMVLSVYVWVGSYFEEQRLVQEFGESYLAYRRLVPRLVPLPRRWLKPTELH